MKLIGRNEKESGWKRRMKDGWQPIYGLKP